MLGTEITALTPQLPSSSRHATKLKSPPPSAELKTKRARICGVPEQGVSKER